jgi:anti-sigma factor (TIGR02949 family)
MSQVNRYTCEEMFRRLDDYVDRELNDYEMQLAREHLETCAACAREYAFESGVLREIKSKLRRIDVAPELLERIAADLARARHASSSGGAGGPSGGSGA